MRYRVLGRTGLTVSEIGFGGAPAGLANYLAPWNPVDEASAQSVIQAITQAIESGINYFDTAPGYGDGASERMFGQAIHPYRERVFIATKFFAANADEVRRSAEASLKNLGVDCIDVLQYHGGWYSEEKVRQIFAPGGVLEGLEALRKEGLVRYLGITTEGVSGPTSQLVASGAFDVLQVCYNLIFQHPYDPVHREGLMYEAEAQGMGIVIMRPLTSGTLPKWLNRVFPEEMSSPERQKRLRDAMLSFVLANPLVDSALVGMRTPQEVIENAALSEEDDLRIDPGWLHTRYV